MSTVSINEFSKIDIRVVEVLKAEPIPERTKILKLATNVGGGVVQTMVVGGAEFYSLDYFAGKKFIALVNLAPKTFAGVQSKGMLLAAEIDGKPVWLTVTEDVPVGTKVR